MPVRAVRWEAGSFPITQPGLDVQADVRARAYIEIKVLQRRLTRLENKIAYYKRVTVSFVTGRERIMDQLRRWRSRVIDRLPHAASSDRRLRLHERVVEYGENIRGQRARIHAKLQLRASQERGLEAEVREITARIRSLEAAA